MLIRFNVSNFLSFDQEQEFSMIAGKVHKFDERTFRDGNGMHLLKFAALYGANASGKSNLIKAMDRAKRIIVNGLSGGKYHDLHFKLKEENKIVPTKFEFEIKIKDRYYAYGFNLYMKQSRVHSEWLYELRSNKEVMIFERDMINKTFKHEMSFHGDEQANDFATYTKDIMNMDNVLFLREIVRKNLQDTDFMMFNDIFEWFDESLIIIYPETVIGSHLKVFEGDTHFDAIQILKYFDTGITSFENKTSNIEELKRYIDDADSDHFESLLERIDNEANELGKNASKKKVRVQGIIRSGRHLFHISFDGQEWSVSKLLFQHGDTMGAIFEFGDESDGTQRLIELLGIIHSDNRGKTILIDELDRSLHPQLTKKFIETFFKFTENYSNQLIITTHESTLLDLQLLRRDEIWFVERDARYSSNLYSLENFKVRYDKRIEKDYLDGRYGAVPLFKEFSSFLSQEESKDSGENDE